MTVQKLRKFAQQYNNTRMCPLINDLLRILYPEGGEQRDLRRRLQRRVEKYRLYREAHPDAPLPELILRSKSGSQIGVPPGVLAQLKRFRFDTRRLKNAKGVIVTSAQFGSQVNDQVWQTLNHLSAYRRFPLIGMPIKYGPIMTVYQQELHTRVLTSTFDERLKGCMIFEDLPLAGGMLNLNVLRMRPTLDRFLPNRICERGGNVSQIFAGPKLELEFRPRLNHEHPKAVMTTGAVTHPSYHTDNLGQQARTGELAAAEHTYSAIIIEFTGKNTFHFRQLLASTDGELYDIDPIRGGAIRITPKGGVEHRPEGVAAAYLGDWHTGKTHPMVREVTFKDMLPKLKPKDIILGDFLDGDSISHWESKQASRRAYKGPRLFNSVKKELDACVAELEWMHSCVPKSTLNVIASNHHDFLGSYVETLEWKKDDVNLAFCSRLFADLQEDMERRKMESHELSPRDPFNFWIERHAPFTKTWGRQDTLLLPRDPKAKKIMVTLHGDIGPSGQKKPGLNAFRELNQWCIVGHVHSAAIFGPVWRVGTAGHSKEQYVRSAATKWTHTHALIFENGQRQLVNIINGSYHGQDELAARRAKKKVSAAKSARKRASTKKVGRNAKAA